MEIGDVDLVVRKSCSQGEPVALKLAGHRTPLKVKCFVVGARAVGTRTDEEFPRLPSRVRRLNDGKSGSPQNLLREVILAR